MNAIALAKRLRGRGHRVWIISTPDAGPAAAAEGVDFAPVLAGLFRTGSLAGEIKYVRSLSRVGKIRAGRRAIRAYRAIMDGLLVPGENDIDRTFDRIQPDLCLFYTDVAYMIVAPLVALRRGLRCASVTPLFASDRGPTTPPLRNGLVPQPGFLGRFAVRKVWARYLTRREIGRRVRLALGFDVDLGPYIRALAAGGAGVGLPARWDCFIAPKLDLPEFHLAPRELEFTGPTRPGSHWLGWCFDEARVEEPLAEGLLDPSRPLVYCSLGTLGPDFVPGPGRRAFFQAVLDALAARPHLQLALATGGDPGGAPLDVRAPGAILRDRLPQLQILDRARVMITHCGLHSLMECATRGVAMIGFPLGFDQFGNSARVVYHGLGVRGDFHRVTAESVGHLIDTVLADAAMTRRCARMAERSRDRQFYEAEMAALEALARPAEGASSRRERPEG